MIEPEINPPGFPHDQNVKVLRFDPAGQPPKTTETIKQTVTASPFPWRNPADIPRRDFLFGGHLIRRFVSGTAAPGGVGKSFLSLAEALSMVSGIPFLGTQSGYDSLNVWYWNLEDPLEEIERRLAAAAQYYHIDPQSIRGKLFVNSGRDTPLVVASKVKDEVQIARPVVTDLLSEIRRNGIDIVIIDPFISSHTVPENDNVAIDRVVKLWGQVADRGNCAVELIHHTRKTGGEAMSEESFRGAKSLVDGLRSARVLHPMQEKDATNLGLGEERRRYFYILPEKQSMAPPAEHRAWFRLNSVEIGNGDNVAAISSWTPPNPFENVRVDHLAQVQRLFRSKDYRESDQATDWGGYAVADVLDLDVGANLRAPDRTKAQRAHRSRIKAILRTWLANGQIGVQMRYDTVRREEKPFFFVPVEADC